MVASKTGSDDLKPDISEEDLKRLYARASAQRFDENPRYPQHTSSGVIPMSVKGRFANERERLGHDFDETQRQWRVKWIKDQHLHPNEPFDVKQLYIEYHNPIRRFYRKPMDLFESWLRQRTVWTLSTTYWPVSLTHCHCRTDVQLWLLASWWPPSAWLTCLCSESGITFDSTERTGKSWRACGLWPRRKTSTLVTHAFRWTRLAPSHGSSGTEASTTEKLTKTDFHGFLDQLSPNWLEFSRKTICL